MGEEFEDGDEEGAEDESEGRGRGFMLGLTCFFARKLSFNCITKGYHNS